MIAGTPGSAAQRARRYLAGLLSVLVIGIAGASAVGAQEAPVRVVAATEEPIRRVLAFAGSVTAAHAASLSPATSGLVESIHVDVGDRVEAGEPLLRLDDELARFQVASDEAAERGARQALADARRRLEEARELVRRRTIAETAVRDLESEVIEDEAAAARAGAVVGLSRTTLARHTLSAPFGGVISERSTDVGEWVTPGTTVLELVSLDELYIDFQVAEEFLGRIETGMPVELRLPGSAGTPVTATIVATVPVTDPTARTFLVRARADDADSAILPGTSADAVLRLTTGKLRVTLPRDAVLRYSDGRSVAWVVETVDGIDRAAERLVETGVSFDGKIEILSGIAAGERVVVAGNEALRNEQAVRVIGRELP
jgi:RND family efflux transporter MFP subunit